MTTSSKRIFITGFMAAGKTTVAASLARRLNCRMIDLDHFIAQRKGRTPPQIIDEDGVARFREIESAALRAVLEDDAARVVALGGGTWTVERNRTLIAEHDGLTVWLDAPFELCWQRIINSSELRPLARDRDEAQRLYEARRPLYGLATLRVQVTEAGSVEEIAAEIAHASLRRRAQM
jgi:shikimate kinase